MADQTIMFKIGSAFKGEGFQKARQTVAEMNGEVKKSAGIANQLSTALGQMDASASKAMQAATGMIQAIATFNVTAIATQAVMTGINLYFDKMKTAAEECKAKIDALAVSVQSAFNATLAKSVKEAVDEAAQISRNFDAATKQVNAFSAALEGVRKSGANGEIINLEVEKLNALLEAHGEAEQKSIEAEYNLKIAVEKRANVETDSAAALEAAHQAVVDAENKIANCDEQIAVIQQKRAELEDAMMVARQSGDANWHKIQAQITALAEKEAALEQQKIDKEAEIDTLREKEKQVKQDGINAVNQATAAVLQVELANKRAAEAAHDKAVKDKAAADAAALKAASDKEMAKRTEDAADLQKTLNKAMQDRLKAEKDLKAAIEAYNARFTENTINNALQGVFGQGLKSAGTIPVNVVKSVQTTVADHVVDEAIRQHLVTTVRDADKMARNAARDARNEMNKNSGQRAREAARYERILNTNEKARSEADKKFMATYEKILKANEAEKKAVEDAKKAQEKAQKEQEQATKALQDIGKTIKDCTAK